MTEMEMAKHCGSNRSENYGNVLGLSERDLWEASVNGKLAQVLARLEILDKKVFGENAELRQNLNGVKALNSETTQKVIRLQVRLAEDDRLTLIEKRLLALEQFPDIDLETGRRCNKFTVPKKNNEGADVARTLDKTLKEQASTIAELESQIEAYRSREVSEHKRYTSSSEIKEMSATIAYLREKLAAKTSALEAETERVNHFEGSLNSMAQSFNSLHETSQRQNREIVVIQADAMLGGGTPEEAMSKVVK